MWGCIVHANGHLLQLRCVGLRYILAQTCHLTCNVLLCGWPAPAVSQSQARRCRQHAKPVCTSDAHQTWHHRCPSRKWQRYAHSRLARSAKTDHRPLVAEVVSSTGLIIWVFLESSLAKQALLSHVSRCCKGVAADIYLQAAFHLLRKKERGARSANGLQFESLTVLAPCSAPAQ